ncbi:hypothetical protein ACFL4G_11240 [Thermodesulfobacteriota bacterium]
MSYLDAEYLTPLFSMEPKQALLVLAENFLSEKDTLKYEDYLETYALFTALNERAIPPVYDPLPTIRGTKEKDLSGIESFMMKVRTELSLQLEKENSKELFNGFREKFRMQLNSGFFYEFSDGDLNRIQELINELRTEIQKSELFDANHKERILKRLESLQKELHKKVSSLDKFYGLIGDAGIALGKFGIDAKPFVDRVREISNIVWRTQARAEELPSGTSLPLLTEGDIEA